MTDPYVEGCHHIAVAHAATANNDLTRAAAHAALATAYFAKGRWEADADAERSAHPVRGGQAPMTPDRARRAPVTEVVGSEWMEPLHYQFACGCVLSIPKKNESDADHAEVFCPIHDPNTRIPRELIEHWQTNDREQPF